MTDSLKKSEAAPKHAPTLYFIAGFKIFKGLLLVAVAVWFFVVAGRDLPEMFDRFLRFVDLDPEKRFFANIGDWLDTVTPRNVQAVASVTMLYGLFLLVGGSGLVARAKWAIWLAIGESAFFIPVEIFELVRRRPLDLANHPHLFSHPRAGLGILLAVNILIVWYLFENRHRLFRHHG
jgi:uncharacterized membrane protein (DUF2068 family)